MLLPLMQITNTVYWQQLHSETRKNCEQYHPSKLWQQLLAVEGTAHSSSSSTSSSYNTQASWPDYYHCC
eukprot:16512-Heterococcus_DN1.PRE.2